MCYNILESLSQKLNPVLSSPGVILVIVSKLFTKKWNYLVDGLVGLVGPIVSGSVVPGSGLPHGSGGPLGTDRGSRFQI